MLFPLVLEEDYTTYSSQPTSRRASQPFTLQSFGRAICHSKEKTNFQLTLRVFSFHVHGQVTHDFRKVRIVDQTSWYPNEIRVTNENCQTPVYAATYDKFIFSPYFTIVPESRQFATTAAVPTLLLKLPIPYKEVRNLRLLDGLRSSKPMRELFIAKDNNGSSPQSDLAQSIIHVKTNCTKTMRTKSEQS